MASLSDPTTAQGRAHSPTTGTISFNAKEGRFYCYFPAEKDSNGNITKEGANVEVRNPKFMVVGVNFFRVIGGKPDRKDRTKFIGVSSPIIVTDKGFKWGQLIPVWVGRDDKSPAITGTWSEIKDAVDAKGGKYAELVFVVCADWPDRLLLLELSGYTIGQFKDAVKAATGSNFSSSLVKSPHIVEMVNTDGYEIDGRTFLKPVFRIMPFNAQSKGYEQMLPILMGFSQKVDAYGDELAALQKSGDLTTQEEGQKTAMPAPSKAPATTGGYVPPTAQPESNAFETDFPINTNITADSTPPFDDLPF